MRLRKVVVDPGRGRLGLVDDDGRQRDARKDDESGKGEVDESNGKTAWDPRPPEAADDRVEEQRDQPRDDEKEDHVTHRAGDRPSHDQHERQPHELNPPRDNQLRRPSRVHADDRTAAQRRPRSAVWDWSFLEDGALALDRHELWTDVEPPSRLRLLQAKVPPDLNDSTSFVTVPRMQRRRTATSRRPTRAQREALRRRGVRRVRRREHRLRRFALLYARRPRCGRHAGADGVRRLDRAARLGDHARARAAVLPPRARSRR